MYNHMEVIIMRKAILSVLFSIMSTACFATPPVFVDSYEEAIESNIPVLIVLGTDWCGACQNLKKEMKGLNLNGYVVCIVDLDKRKDLLSKHKVQFYPTSVILKDKKEVSKKVGYSKKADYQKWLDNNR